MTLGALLRISPNVDKTRLEAIADSATKRLEPWPPATSRTLTKNSFGKPELMTDWRNLFAKEISETGWRRTLAKWIPTLVPGVMASATHGLIRTAYAIEYLLFEETKEREHELAIALAYWTARYQPLPETAGEAETDNPVKLLEKIKRLPNEKRVGGLIFLRVIPLNDFTPFHKTKSLLKTGNAEQVLNDLSKISAKLYIQNSGKPAITFIHCLTATHAVRVLLRILPEAGELAVSHLWSAIAALYCADSEEPFTDDYEPDLSDRAKDISTDWDELLKIASSVDTDHIVKYAYSTFEENRVNPDPVYGKALALWLDKNLV